MANKLLASLLETAANQPSSLDGMVISSTASMAISHIRRLEDVTDRLQRALAWMDNADPNLVECACNQFGLDADTYDKKEPNNADG